MVLVTHSEVKASAMASYYNKLGYYVRIVGESDLFKVEATPYTYALSMLMCLGKK